MESLDLQQIIRDTIHEYLSGCINLPTNTVEPVYKTIQQLLEFQTRLLDDLKELRQENTKLVQHLLFKQTIIKDKEMLADESFEYLKHIGKEPWYMKQSRLEKMYAKKMQTGPASDILDGSDLESSKTKEELEKT